jgi:hypothetical protein
MERLREQHEATVRERALLETGASGDGADG